MHSFQLIAFLGKVQVLVFSLGIRYCVIFILFKSPNLGNLLVFSMHSNLFKKKNFKIPYNPGPDKSTNDHILSEILRMIIYRALNLTVNVGTVLWVRLCSDCVTPPGSCTAFINYSGKTTVTKKSNFLEYKT